MNPSPNPYVYVVVRKDIDDDDKLVQAVHAGMLSARAFPVENPWLAILGVANTAELIAAQNKLSAAGIRTVLFHEDDDDLRATAFATEPLTGAQRNVMGGLACLRRRR